MNRLYIEPTKFIDVRSDHETFGFRWWDDFDQGYDNNLESIPDDDLEFLELIIREHDSDELGRALEFAYKDSKSICIGDTWYSYEQWGPILTKVWDDEPKKET